MGEKQEYARLGKLQLGAWGLVPLIATMMLLPLNALIPAFYAKNTATTLAEVGLIFLIARIYDAFADPVIGVLSDRTRSPLGRRKPWLIGGAFIAAISGWLLFNPGPSAGFIYLLPVALVFYTAYSMLTVPHSAWGAEVTSEYEERSLVSGLLTFMGVAGLLIFMGLPVLLSSPLFPVFPSAEITPDMLKLLGWLIVIGAPLCVIPSVFLTPVGNVKEKDASFKLKDAIFTMKENRPFKIFMLAYLMSSLGYGVYYATTYLFLDYYLGLAHQFPLIYAIAAISQIVSIPFWTRLGQFMDRRLIWAIGIGLFGAILPLRVFLPYGDEGFWLLILLTVSASVANAASQVPQMAMIADCIDYSEQHGGQDIAGSYYAVQQFCLKTSLAIGGAVAFFILQLVDFDPKATSHSDYGLSGLAWVHTFAPSVLFIACALIILKFPINRSLALKFNAGTPV